MFLSIFLFNLIKFSFSKDILVGYNKRAAGYHFDTFDNISVLNKIADHIDYSRVLGLNSTVIIINK